MSRSPLLLTHIISALQGGRELTAYELAAETGCSAATARWALKEARRRHAEVRTRPEDWNGDEGEPRMGAPRVSYFWMPQ